MKNDEYININKIAEIKGLKSNRSLRIAIQKGKYIAREVQVNGGTSYEIKYSSLEVEIQERLEDEEIKSTALVPVNNTKLNFVSETARLTSLARVDLVAAYNNLRNKYKTKKETEEIFLELYNSGLYLPQVYKFIGKISLPTLRRYVQAYENGGTKALIPQRRYSSINEYNTILNDEMKQVFLKFLLHPNKYKVGTAINLTRHILEKRGYENIPCVLTFRRFAQYYKKTHYGTFVFAEYGEKGYHDMVEEYIERDISKLEVGDVLIADGHVLNFQVQDPFSGKPTRATLVGFLDWKSTALVGYEIMMTENTQGIVSALRNAIINLGLIPKIVYQDNGKAFKAKYFQKTDFTESGFNGVYSNLGIKSVFAKPYNARAKVIERFFLDFQEEFEKMMPSYIGTSIENKPAWLNRNEKMHKELHKKLTNNYVPTVQEVSAYINYWLDYHNNKICPNAKDMTIKECLNTVQKQDIDINILNDLMMKTEPRVINKHGITFLGMHYRNDLLLNLREKVYIRYSLFDLTKIHVYSLKGEFLCVAHRVEKVHPMANYLGTVKDMEDYKQKIKKQKRQFKKAKKEFLKYYPQAQEIMDIEPQEPVIEIEQFEEVKPVRERKLTEREEQMSKPMFN